jgi:hypothetical protein
MYVVYGLEDQRNYEIFYVGITDNIQSRYLQHLRCDGSNPTKDARILEMLEVGYMPLPRTLQIVVDLEQAKRRESYWMRHFYDLGITLTNQVIPLVQQESVMFRTVDVRLGNRMTLDEQRYYIHQLASTGISHVAIYSMVDKYIPRELVKVLLREYAQIARSKRVQPPQEKVVSGEFGFLPQALEASLDGESWQIEQVEWKIERILAMLDATQEDQFKAIWQVVPGKGEKYKKAKAERVAIYRYIQSSLRTMSTWVDNDQAGEA